MAETAVASAGEDRSAWLNGMQQKNNFTAQGLPFCQSVNGGDMLTREGIQAMALEQHRNKKTYDDYFTVGGDHQDNL